MTILCQKCHENAHIKEYIFGSRENGWFGKMRKCFLP